MGSLSPSAPRRGGASRARALLPFAIAAGLMAGLTALTLDLGFDPADEGFLWYGVWRTGAGEVPMRDFQSYDPGRYYWGALGVWLFNPGLLTMRLWNEVFAAIGLGFGLAAAQRVVSRPLALAALGVLLAVWMFPRHKLFEPALAMMAVWVGLQLVEAPTLRRHALAGTFVGVVAFFGRNHGLYAGLAMLALVLWLGRERRGPPLLRALAALAVGGAVGILPLAGMLLFVPGFAEGFMDAVMAQLHHGVNLPYPAPWPWTLDPASLASSAGRANWATGFVLLLLPVGYGVGLVCSLRRAEPGPARYLLAAATAVGLAYSHHTTIRSDAIHLAQAIHPLWLAAAAIPPALSPRLRRTALGWIWAGAALLSLAILPAANHQIRLLTQGDLAVLRVGADTVRMPRAAVAVLSPIEGAVERQLGPGDALFLAPDLPGLYPALGKTSPIHGIYLLLPESPEVQRSIIEQLEERRVRVVLISAGSLDGRKEYTFPNTHPLVWDHLRTRFELVRGQGLAPQFLLFVRREARAEPSSGDNEQ